MEVEEAIALFGTAQSAPGELKLTAGPLSCRLCEGALKDVRWRDVEVVRAVSYLFRDQDWGTVPSVVQNLLVEQEKERFRVGFDLHVLTLADPLVVSMQLEGTAAGRLAFVAKTTPGTTLRTNRCGFVVLHPAAVAGRSLFVEHTDGARETTAFPLKISPSQPVFDIRKLTYSASDGVIVECLLEAELPHDPMGKFEMEDQRNWSDASFKTYVASLLDASPYDLPEGKPSTQCISLTMSGQSTTSTDRAEDEVRLSRLSGSRMPAFGVGVPPRVHRAGDLEVRALREVGASWWMAEVDLRGEDAMEDLASLGRHRKGLSVRVQVDAIVPDELLPRDAASALAEACARASLAPDAVRLLPASYLKSYQPADEWPALPPLESYAAAARLAFPAAAIGGGMLTYFTELNRKRQSSNGIDFIGHATCPIVHAADDESVMQTLETLPHIISSVREIWPSLPYRLGPSTISMRRNPYGESPVANTKRERVAMAMTDPREGAQFGVAWMAAYALIAAQAGVDVLALGASHGPSGPFANSIEDGTAREITPARKLLASLAKASGAEIAALTNLPPGVFGLAWTHDGHAAEILLVNTTLRPQDVHWADEFVDARGVHLGEMILPSYDVRLCSVALRTSQSRR
jgi:hypothetical protein